jgi:hypothetical protein
MPAPGPEKMAELQDFIARHRLAVLASSSANGAPQAALVNIAVTPALEIIFETTCETRKFANLERDPRAALVIGSGQETLQYEGLAMRPEGWAREAARDAFIAAFPDKAADENWPGNSYFLVRPQWLRFSSYYRPRAIAEYVLEERKAAEPSRLCWLRTRRFPPRA